MRMTHWKKFFSIAMAAMLIVLAGCQSIAGTDISKVLAKSATNTSSESNLSLSFELLKDDKAELTGTEKDTFDLLKSVKLTLDSIKVQDDSHLSAQGNLEVKDKKIPVQFTLEDQTYTIHIDGAKKPIQFNMMAEAAGQGSLSTSMLENLSGMKEQVRQAMPILITYLVDHFPDMKVTADHVFETINGESVNLQKLHIELNGEQLFDLLKQLIINLAEDKEGLEQLIDQLLDALLPAFVEMAKTDPALQQYAVYLNNKQLVKALIMSKVATALDEVAADLKDVTKDDLSILSGLNLKFDLYIDSNLDIRKQAMELSYTLPEEAGLEPMKGFVLRMASDQWNIGKPVTADKIDTSKGVLDGFHMSTGKFVANFDKESAFYKLLKEDLKVTKSKRIMYLKENAEEAAKGLGYPYKKNGQTTMVPTRYLLEGLEAEVKWDGDTRQITVTDYLSDKTIVLTVGSDKAYVNGVEKVMPESVEIVGEWSFVPVRFIATECGFNVDWDEITQRVTITRD